MAATSRPRQWRRIHRRRRPFSLAAHRSTAACILTGGGRRRGGKRSRLHPTLRRASEARRSASTESWRVRGTETAAVEAHEAHLYDRRPRLQARIRPGRVAQLRSPQVMRGDRLDQRGECIEKTTHIGFGQASGHAVFGLQALGLVFHEQRHARQQAYRAAAGQPYHLGGCPRRTAQASDKHVGIQYQPHNDIIYDVPALLGSGDGCSSSSIRFHTRLP